LATLRATKKAYFTPNNTHTPSLTPNLTPALIDTALYSRRRSRSEYKPDHNPVQKVETQHQHPEPTPKILKLIIYVTSRLVVMETLVPALQMMMILPKPCVK